MSVKRVSSDYVENSWNQVWLIARGLRKIRKVIWKVKHNLYCSFDMIIDKYFQKTVVHHLLISAWTRSLLDSDWESSPSEIELTSTWHLSFMITGEISTVKCFEFTVTTSFYIARYIHHFCRSRFMEEDVTKNNSVHYFSVLSIIRIQIYLKYIFKYHFLNRVYR